MEKSIKICGREVPFKATGGLSYRYKSQFGRELLADLAQLEDLQKTAVATQEKVKKPDGSIEFIPHISYDLTKFSLEFLYDLIWTLAKTADESIPPPQQWLDGFDRFPVMDIWTQIQDLVTQNLQVDPKNG